MAFKRVTVEWKDSASMAGWFNQGDAQTAEPILIKTVGFLLSESKGEIVIAHSIDEDNGTALGGLTIPRACITSLKRFG